MEIRRQFASLTLIRRETNDIGSFKDGSTQLHLRRKNENYASISKKTQQVSLHLGFASFVSLHYFMMSILC